MLITRIGICFPRSSTKSIRSPPTSPPEDLRATTEALLPLAPHLTTENVARLTPEQVEANLPAACDLADFAIPESVNDASRYTAGGLPPSPDLPVSAGRA